MSISNKQKHPCFVQGMTPTTFSVLAMFVDVLFSQMLLSHTSEDKVYDPCLVHEFNEIKIQVTLEKHNEYW